MWWLHLQPLCWPWMRATWSRVSDCYRLTPVCWCWTTTVVQIQKNELKQKHQYWNRLQHRRRKVKESSMIWYQNCKKWKSPCRDQGDTFWLTKSLKPKQLLIFNFNWQKRQFFNELLSRLIFKLFLRFLKSKTDMRLPPICQNQSTRY